MEMPDAHLHYYSGNIPVRFTGKNVHFPMKVLVTPALPR
jgi:hypothetical protein